MKSENRRSFLKRAAMAAVVPALGTPAAGLSGWLTQSAGPHIKFAATPRERISVSTYPFREFIIGQHDEKSAGAKKMPLRDFPAHAVAKFKISKIEPWSEHFTSLEPAYLDELRNAAGKAGCGFANLAADGENSLYSPDSAERQRAIQFGKTWIDVAVRLGSPSVRLNLATAKNAKPDASLVAEGLKTIADYAATKNIVVHCENDNPVSEDPFFIVTVLDRVNSPWLHALPDFGNSLGYLPAEDAYRGLDQLFAHAYGISHVKDTTTTPANVVVPLDMARIFALAKKHNYKGIFSMEWETAGDVYAGTAALIATTLQNLS